MRRKYYKTKKEALMAKAATNNPNIHVWKMPKPGRHAGMYAVCTDGEYYISD